MDKELLGYIDSLATKLNVTADKLYDVFMLQANIQLVTDIIQIILSFIIFGLAIVGGRKFVDWDEPSMIGFLVAIVTTFSLVAVCINLSQIGEILTLLFNPEYWAITKILGNNH
jgi:hypothetical protein